jgi:hypothetical protein
MSISLPLKQLSDALGSLLFDDLHKTICNGCFCLPYRSNVALPKSDSDIVKLIHFANQHKISLIPRTAGTSLAGQTVGEGIDGRCIQTFYSDSVFRPYKEDSYCSARSNKR